MTIQVVNPAHGKSKKALQEALNTNPDEVMLHNPSVFAGWTAPASNLKPGNSFPVVMDYPKRKRFASIIRLADNSFKVR